jgi:hypothetical protein
MKRRHLVAAVLVAGGLLFVGWIAMNTYWDTVAVPGLMSGEALRNPDYAATRLARALGAGLRRIEDPLSPLPAPPHVLLLADMNLDFEPERQRQLERWVMDGGHLVFDQTVTIADPELRRWSGLTQSLIEQKPAPERQGDGDGTEGADEPAPVVIPATPRCPAYRLRHAGADESASYDLCGFRLRARLQTARRPDFALGDSEGLQVVRVPLGRGSLTVLNASGPFGNRELLRGDNALLFATVTRLHRGADIWVLRGGKHATLLAAIWNRAAAVVILLAAALALALWRAAVRFGPVQPAAEPMRRSLRSQIAGTAEFLRTHGGSSTLWQACARALETALERHLPHQSRLTPAERSAALARLTGLPQHELDEALSGAGRARAETLARRISLLEQARRRLLRH